MLLKAEEIPFELVLINKSFFIIKKEKGPLLIFLGK